MVTAIVKIELNTTVTEMAVSARSQRVIMKKMTTEVNLSIMQYMLVTEQ